MDGRPRTDDGCEVLEVESTKREDRSVDYGVCALGIELLFELSLAFSLWSALGLTLGSEERKPGGSER